jgi:Ca-activated chloride channel family protein
MLIPFSKSPKQFSVGLIPAFDLSTIIFRLLVYSFLLCFSLFFFSCVSSSGQHNQDQTEIGFNTSSSDVDQQGSDTGSEVDVHHSVSTTDTGIVFKVDPSQSQFLIGSKGELYWYITLQTGILKNKEKRPPLNISVVLDRSGSMSGEKIEYAKKAASFLVDQLSDNDMVSIVNYDNTVEVSSKSGTIKNRENLKAIIEKITDRGGTNLSGGMLEGFHQVSSTQKSNYVNRVLLLTDGLANEGITDPLALKKLVQAKFKENNIALSTFGLGADYNEDLLTQLADAGHANYYFIDKADKIPSIFGEELQGLLSVVAQNAVLELELPKGWACKQVFGYPFEQTERSVRIRFQDLYENNTKAVLIKLTNEIPFSEKTAFNFSLYYTDAQNFKPFKRISRIQISPSPSFEVVKNSLNKEVEEMIALFESAQAMENIMAEVDKGNYDEAKRKANASIEVLKKKQVEMPSPKLKARQEELTIYLEQMEEVKTMQDSEKKMYQKSNKLKNYELIKQKRGS